MSAQFRPPMDVFDAVLRGYPVLESEAQEARAAIAGLIEALKLIESAKERGFGIDYARGVALAAIAKAGGAA